jgi:GMP synthase (glutamine-hydrolysing)
MPMKFLILMHNETEVPGSLGTYLESAGGSIELLKLYEGASIPATTDGFSAIISMGGPMNVYEEEKYPFLRDETLFLSKAIKAGIPTLGVCLGAQMIAKALGASVTKSPKKEVGWSRIDLTKEGQIDSLFDGLPPYLEVFQWHEDMFHIPEGGAKLAGSADCPNQAFRYKNAFGLQFHVEVTPEILSSWFSDSLDFPAMMARHAEIKGSLSKHAERMYENFVKLVKQS